MSGGILSNDVEAMIIGAALGRADYGILDGLSADDFEKPEHREAFSHLMRCRQEGKPADCTLLSSIHGYKGEYLFQDYLDSIPEGVSTINARNWATELRRTASERTLKRHIENGQEILSLPGGIEKFIAGVVKIGEDRAKIKDAAGAERLFNSRDTFAEVMRKHEETIGQGGIGTGFPLIDNHVFFAKGDFNIIQSKSNHGKTSFMFHLAYNFLKAYEHTDVIYITYEASEIRVKERLLNIIAAREIGGRIVSQKEDKIGYTYNPDGTVAGIYDKYTDQDRLKIFYGLSLSELRGLVAYQKAKRPAQTLVLFVDYIQIFPYESQADNWQRIKELAYELERVTTENGIIMFAGSQVNEQGEVREGKDIYNAATNVIDIFNHGHEKLKRNEDKRYLDKSQYDGKSVISVTLDKSKNFSSGHWEHYLLFDGYSYTPTPQDWRDQAQQQQSSPEAGKKQKKEKGTTDYGQAFKNL